MQSNLGLRLVYPLEDDEAEAEEAAVDIVFVHGLFGDPYDTWATDTVDPSTKRTRKIFWPRELLSKVVPRARVFVWGFDADISRLFSNASQTTLFEHSRTLLSDLADERISDTDKLRPLIFVAYSLGGILVKDALNCSHSERTHLNEILPSTFGVIFLGTPHRGSKAAKLGRWAFEVTKLLANRPNTGLLRDMERGSATLDCIGRSFGQVSSERKFKVQTVFEELPMSGTHGKLDIPVYHHGKTTPALIFFQTTDRTSYASWDPLEVAIGIPADHVHLTKYTSVTDVGFKRISAVLKRWSAQIESEKPKGTDSENIEAALRLGKDCLNTLDYPECRYQFEDLITAHAETFQWLFSSDVNFEKWLRGDLTQEERVFWITGKPGSGKSTLMKYAFKETRTRIILQGFERTRVVLAGFFFFERGTSMQKSMEGLLYELIFQILSQAPELMPIVIPTYEKEIHPQRIAKFDDINSEITLKMGRKVPWTLRQLRRCLWGILTQRHTHIKLCLFIDGLDEFHDKCTIRNDIAQETPDFDDRFREIAEFINEVAAAADGNFVKVRICVASRPLTTFEYHYGQEDALVIRIHEKTRYDILSYAKSRLKRALDAAAAVEDGQNLQTLVDEVAEKSSGVFIWVRLAINELLEGVADGDDVDQLRERLKAIPKEIEDLYCRILQRIRYKYALEAYIMLQITLHQSRPIVMRDLFAIVNYHLYDDPLSESHPPYPTASQVQMKRRLMSRCHGLLELTNDTNKQERKQYVQFLHLTLKDYLRINPKEAAKAVFKGDTNRIPPYDGRFYIKDFNSFYPMDAARMQCYSSNLYYAIGVTDQANQNLRKKTIAELLVVEIKQPSPFREPFRRELDTRIAGSPSCIMEVLRCAIMLNLFSYIEEIVAAGKFPRSYFDIYSLLQCAVNPARNQPSEIREAISMSNDETADINIIRILLQQLGDLSSLESVMDRTALVHLTVSNNNFSARSLNVVRALLEHSALSDPVFYYNTIEEHSQSRPSGRTFKSLIRSTRLLHHVLRLPANCSYRAGLLLLLLEYGADPTECDEFENSAWDYTDKQGRELLVKKGHRHT